MDTKSTLLWICALGEELKYRKKRGYFFTAGYARARYLEPMWYPIWLACPKTVMWGRLYICFR